MRTLVCLTLRWLRETAVLLKYFRDVNVGGKSF